MILSLLSFFRGWLLPLSLASSDLVAFSRIDRYCCCSLTYSLVLFLSKASVFISRCVEFWFKGGSWIPNLCSSQACERRESN